MTDSPFKSVAKLSFLMGLLRTFGTVSEIELNLLSRTLIWQRAEGVGAEALRFCLWG